MSNAIAYSVLKYKHIEKLGESINLALLFIFPGVHRVEFVFPKSLSRLKKAFPDAEVDIVKSYLLSFKKQEKVIEKRIKQVLFDYDSILEDFFFSQPSGALQFEPFHHCLLIKDVESTIRYYSQTYLSAYDSLPSRLKHKTGAQLVKTLQQKVISLNPDLANVLREEREPIVNGKVHFKVDLKWENNTIHLVKGLSLDLDNEESITDKALLVQNQLNYLSKKIRSLNAGVDLLLASPHRTEFHDAYQQAVNILKEADTTIRLYEEQDLDEYSTKVLHEAHF